MVFLGQSVDILLSKKSWPCMERNISTGGAGHMMTSWVGVKRSLTHMSSRRPSMSHLRPPQITYRSGRWYTSDIWWRLLLFLWSFSAEGLWSDHGNLAIRSRSSGWPSSLGNWNGSWHTNACLSLGNWHWSNCHRTRSWDPWHRTGLGDQVLRVLRVPGIMMGQEMMNVGVLKLWRCLLHSLKHLSLYMVRADLLTLHCGR